MQIKISSKFNFIFLLTIFLIVTCSSSKQGLTIKGSNDEIPLKKIHYNVKIIEGIARVELTQEYFNNYTAPIETEYYFPINHESAFDKFEAIINDKIVSGVIKEKAQAKAEYDEQIKLGNTAAYSEINKDTHDIMQINVGNIMPGEKIQIKFAYLETLKVALNMFNQFIIHSTITERYNPANSGIENLPIYTIPDDHSPIFKWSIDVEIQSKDQLDFIYSPSHKINIKTEGKTTLLSIDESDRIANKDFVLFFKDEHPNKPKLIIENHPNYTNESLIVIDFYPKFNTLTADQAKEFLSLTKEPLLESDIANSKVEFFFIIDRSGSMAGDRIEKLQHCLTSFLSKLPENSYFNILSFGHHYELLFEESKLASFENTKHAINEIQKYSANMGGTEIYQAMEYALKKDHINNYPRIIFLMTDGDVTNADQIIYLIRNENHFSRIFTIGIGNGISPYLIKEMAKAGNGDYEYVKDSDNLEEKTKTFLLNSISPYAKDFKIETQHMDLIHLIVPKIEDKRFVMKNERVRFNLFVDSKDLKKITDSKIKISYINSITGSLSSYELKISSDSIQTHSDSFHKLAIKQKFLENLKKKDYNKSENIPDSVKYQVLSEETAFVSFIQYRDNIEVILPEKKIIPQIVSNDYRMKADLSYGYSATPIKQMFIPQDSIQPQPTFFHKGIELQDFIQKKVKKFGVIQRFSLLLFLMLSLIMIFS